MQTIVGAGNQVVNRTGAERQISINNKDSTNAMNVKVNEDSVGFTVEASGLRGWRLNTGIYSVNVIAIGSWELTFGT